MRPLGDVAQYVHVEIGRKIEPGLWINRYEGIRFRTARLPRKSLSGEGRSSAAQSHGFQETATSHITLPHSCLPKSIRSARN